MICHWVLTFEDPVEAAVKHETAFLLEIEIIITVQRHDLAIRVTNLKGFFPDHL